MKYFLLILSFFLTSCSFAVPQHENLSSGSSFFFQQNIGQHEDQVLFYADLPQGYLFVTDNEIVHVFESEDQKWVVKEGLNALDYPPRGLRPLDTQVHSLKGDQTYRDIPVFEAIELVSPGFSLEISSEGPLLKRVVQVNDSRILKEFPISVEGADIVMSNRGDLMLESSFGKLIYPPFYSESSGKLSYVLDQEAYHLAVDASEWAEGREYVSVGHFKSNTEF